MTPSTQPGFSVQNLGPVNCGETEAVSNRRRSDGDEQELRRRTHTKVNMATMAVVTRSWEARIM